MEERSMIVDAVDSTTDSKKRDKLLKEIIAQVCSNYCPNCHRPIEDMIDIKGRRVCFKCHTDEVKKSAQKK
jgi:hypothetical protein